MGIIDPGAGLDSEGTERSFARGLAQDDSVCGLRLGCSIQALDSEGKRFGKSRSLDFVDARKLLMTFWQHESS